MKFMFFVIQVNLLLWLAVAGAAWTAVNVRSVGQAIDPWAITESLTGAGLGSAIVLQHWAYHRLRKMRGDVRKSASADERQTGSRSKP